MNLQASLAGLMAASGLYRLLWLAATGGVGFCAAAAYLALQPQMGAAGAALITGVGLLGLVAVLMGVAYARLHRHRRKADHSAKTEEVLQELMGDVLGEWAQDHTRQAVVAALVAGVVTGASPGARRRLLELLEQVSDRR